MNQNKTKRAFSLIFALALVFAAATLFAPVSAADAYENLLVLGDSISTGYGLDNPGIESYGAKLAEAMGLPKQGYLNLAKDGANSADLINLLKMAETAEIISEHNLIVVSIGGNDLLGPFFALAKQALGLEADAPSEALPGAFEKNQNAMPTIAAALLENQASFVAIAGDFAQNLAEIIDLIKAANPGAQILVQTIYDPFDGVPDFEMLSMASGILISQMNQAILGGAAEAGYIALDIAAAFEGAALLYTNIAAFDIHPNAAGHNLIFEEIYAAICGEEETEAQEEPSEPDFAENPFADIGEGDWCYESAVALYYAGLMNGISEEPRLFAPELKLSRAMAAALVYRIAASPDVDLAANMFADVEEGAWYAQAAKWAAQTGIMPIAGGSFEPEAAVSLMEFADMLSGYAGLMGAELSSEAIIATIPDFITAGSGDASRAQAAVMLNSALAIFDY